jgi:hypothetical protein
VRYAADSSFSPQSIQNLIAWYAADRISGISNGASVSSWPDLSGNGNNLSQATGANQPTYLVSSINGRPAVSFNGTSSVMSLPGAFSAGNNNTLFCVFQPTTASIGGLLDSAPATSNVYRNYTAGSWEWNANAPTFPLTLLNANPVLIGLTASLAPSRQVLYERNNMLISTNTNASTAAMAWTNPVIGNVNGAAPWYSGTIAELLIYNRSLLAAERTLIAQYLSAKWGITLNT